MGEVPDSSCAVIIIYSPSVSASTVIEALAMFPSQSRAVAVRRVSPSSATTSSGLSQSIS
jgi:hypothetical protein